MSLLLVGLAAFAATFLGGLFAFRLKDRLHLVLGFSAGAILSVTFFDLIPEALELTAGAFDLEYAMLYVALGFGGFLLLDRLMMLRGPIEHEGHFHRGIFGAGSLSAHSFLDGLGIGLAFQLSSALGLVVTAAVLTHAFSDGINTVNLILKNGGGRSQALMSLIFDAIAPALGIFASLFISVSAPTLGLLLAVFAGFFLYLGAADLLPESHHHHPVVGTTLMTLVGMALLYVVIELAHV